MNQHSLPPPSMRAGPKPGVGGQDLKVNGLVRPAFNEGRAEARRRRRREYPPNPHCRCLQ